MDILCVYQKLMTMGKPLLKIILVRRVKKGLEDSTRYIEKMGFAKKTRPMGKLVWINAVSIGESVSALGIIEQLINKNINVLITTTTLTSAKIMHERLPKNAIHQFMPMDVECWVNRFLDYWQPDMVLWFESELWPTTLKIAHQRKIPIFLLNARFSERTIRKLRKIPKLATSVFKLFDKIYTQTDYYADVIFEITSIKAKCIGNLKYSATQQLNIQTSEDLKADVLNRKVLAIVSSHKEDERFMLPAIKSLSIKIPTILFLIIPRHPNRKDEIIKLFKDFTIAVRSKRERIKTSSQIYLADTIGEVQSLLRIAHITFVGGTTEGGYGGHNPLEAANAKSVIIQGYDTKHFEDINHELTKKAAQIKINTPLQLVSAVMELLNDEKKCAKLTKNATAVTISQHKTVHIIVDEVITKLKERA